MLRTFVGGMMLGMSVVGQGAQLCDDLRSAITEATAGFPGFKGDSSDSGRLHYCRKDFKLNSKCYVFDQTYASGGRSVSIKLTWDFSEWATAKEFVERLALDVDACRLDETPEHSGSDAPRDSNDFIRKRTGIIRRETWRWHPYEVDSDSLREVVTVELNVIERLQRRNSEHTETGASLEISYAIKKLD